MFFKPSTGQPRLRHAWVASYACVIVATYGALLGACSSLADVTESTDQAPLANDSAKCQGKSVTERRKALIDLHDNTDPDQTITCGNDDTACPCGSYCSIDTTCHVECLPADLAQDAPDDLICSQGNACTPQGRCAPSVSTPPPSRLALALAMSPTTVSGNTASGPVLVPVTVNVDANSLDFLQPEHPAVVRYSFVGIDDPALPPDPDVSGPPPLVRCADGAALKTSCEIQGGWRFNVASGNLHSEPRTIWVQLPQRTTAQNWTLRANSDWTAVPATSVVQALPVVYPDADPGHYSGTMAWTNVGTALSDQDLSLPVEAIVAATHIALFEPTRVFFPDGHVVISRDAAKTTMLGWLTSSVGSGAAARYDVRLDVGIPFSYDHTSGQLGGGLKLYTGTFTATPLALSLQRTGDIDAPACPTSGSCAAGRYCDAVMNRCLPGAGPAAGGGIVAASGQTSVPTSYLASGEVAAWSAPLATVVSTHLAQLGGIGITGFGQAYCYQTSSSSPASFAGTLAPKPPSWDLECTNGGAPYQQPAFQYANLQQEVVKGTNGADTFNLLDTCVSDLGAQPTGAATAENLLAPKQCVSLGRFFLALRLAQNSDTGVRLVAQILRQWLGVNAYVANTAVQDKQYDDVLGGPGATAQERLGSAVDLMEQNLGVMLDPNARVKYAGSGPLSQIAAAAPDYRVLPHPLVRWTFNAKQTPVIDTEGSGVALATTGVDVSLSNLVASGIPGPARTCQATQSVALDAGRGFTIMANIKYSTVAGTITLFEKIATNGDRLWVEATNSGMNGLLLVMKDSAGGSVAFPAVPRDTQGGWGLLAIVADGGSFRIHQAQPGLPTSTFESTSVVNGGPHWGSSGIVKLMCDLPGQRNTCTSWDRNTPGDALDVAVQPTRDEITGTITRSCTRSCTRNPPEPLECQTVCQDNPPAQECNNRANARRAALVLTISPNPPASALNAFTVTGTPVNTSSAPEGSPVTSYQCDLKVTKFPFPVTSAKPVCGWMTQSITWDEVSMWDRPVPPEEVTAMATRFNFVATGESLPPKDSNPPPGNEQPAGLAVHLLEAADADLNLLSAYLDAERNVIYAQCYQGGASPARDRALNRAGRNLRMVAVIADEAANLTTAPDTTTTEWYQRYQADLQKLAGSRRKALEALKLAIGCKNPLGISEDDLPLYVGDPGDNATAQFYASSGFLAGLATTEIGLATRDLEFARNAYAAQQQAKFQEDQANINTEDRIRNLRLTYESTLRRYCGAPAADNGSQGEQQLLDGFLAHTLTPSNCFFKMELPACKNLVDAPLSAVPPNCLRGEMGERLVAVQSAGIDADYAQANSTRADADYNQAEDHCALLQALELHNWDVLEQHQAAIRALRRKEQDVGLIAGVIKGVQNIAAAALTGGKVHDSGGISSVADLGLALYMNSLENDTQDEQDAYALFVQAQQGSAEVMACYSSAESKRFTSEAAFEVITRAAHDTLGAILSLDNDQNIVAAVADEAAGQLSLEATIDRTPPHLHYWLNENIKAYRQEMSYARRLTYLALRALEYETQTSNDRRGDVLTARNPADLQVVVTFIGQHNAPLEGTQDLSIDHAPEVLSLRDELLHTQGLVANSTALPGQPSMTAQEVFQRFLMSDAAKIYDTGNDRKLLGRGFRFSLSPQLGSWSDTKCSERIVRITASVQFADGVHADHTELLLYQDNAFGSQTCGGEDGTVHVARVQQSHNLLVDDTSTDFQERHPKQSITIDGPHDKTIFELKDLASNGTLGFARGFAGRGLYGNYMLVFPKCVLPGCSGTGGYSDNVIAKITDVYLRFDIVFKTDGGDPALRTGDPEDR